MTTRSNRSRSTPRGSARKPHAKPKVKSLQMIFLPEPLLEFGHGQKMVYPRDGLFLFGPSGDSSDVPAVRYGAIGTPDGVRRLASWASKVSRFIPIPTPGPRSRQVEPQHVPFPGFSEAFHCDWPTEPVCAIDDIDSAEIDKVLRLANRYEAIHEAVDLYVSRLTKEHNRLENPPAFWFVVIPEIVYELGRPNSTVPKDEQIQGQVELSARRARQLKTQPTLYGVEDEDAKVYEYAKHFRRQLKARLLKDRIVTQIVRETTLVPEEFLRPDGRPQRKIEDAATIAWKLGTGSFYKAGGKPWQLANVRSGVCYVGLVYKRNDLSLVEMVTAEYRSQHDQKAPSELFIHATSTFTDEEWAGFSEGVDSTTNLVGVQIKRANEEMKLFRPGEYPVIRGSALLTGKRSAYLWASGYAARLDTFMGPETPNPLLIRIVRGECPLKTVLEDILGLTKINFNSCLHNDGLPVTIRFANAVGDVLISAPIDSEPRLPFKFYI